MNDIERAQKYVNSIEGAVAGNSGHAATYRVCRLLVNDYNLSEDDAWEILISFNERCEPPWSEKTLRAKLRDAINKPRDSKSSDKSKGVSTSKINESLPPLQRFKDGIAHYPITSTNADRALPNLDLNLLNKLSNRGEKYLTAHFFANISTTDPSLISPHDYLQSLYYPKRGEKVLIFANIKSQGQCLWPDEASKLPLVSKNGVCFCAQPVDGFFRNSGNGKKTRRSQECVLSWRYMLLESDSIDDKEKWLAALIMLPLPIASIVSSGKRSIHVLLRVDAKSRFEWSRVATQYLPGLVAIGADPQALKNALVSPRLPGHTREVDGVLKYQRILYINPCPTTRPLFTMTKLRNVIEFWKSKSKEIYRDPNSFIPSEINITLCSLKFYKLNDWASDLSDRCSTILNTSHD